MALDERHPDAERLAEYAEGVLDAEARAEVERHLAGCAECRAVVMETMAFLDIKTIEPRPRVVPFRTRRWVTGVAIGLAAAAALVLAIRVARPEWVSGLFGSRGDRPELQELIAAVANEPTRPVEGRLSGGFKYGQPPSATRGIRDRQPSPDVTIAASNLAKAVGQSDTPSSLSTLGVAYLVTGDLDKAIDAFSEAVRRDPNRAATHSDLAASYVARGISLSREDDFGRAVQEAQRALELKPDLLEARFNLIISLEHLHLAERVVEECRGYLRQDSTSRWAEECRSKLQSLSRSALPSGHDIWLALSIGGLS